jgi:hypothetical protein
MSYDDGTPEIIDSRDLIARADEIEAANDAADDGEDDDRDQDARDEETELLAAIRELADQGIEDWEDGATLIREDYFKTYAQEFAEDIGAMPDANAWPGSYIDWDRAADALAMDYTSVTFLGTDYYVR